MYPPLEGIQVIDVTETQAGSICTQMLAWFGATVHRVEPSTILAMAHGHAAAGSPAPDSVCADGPPTLDQLVQDADILVDTFASGTLERLGLAWESLQALNPRLIHGTVRGGADKSPYGPFLKYEEIAQCVGGAAATTGWEAGPPMLGGVAMAQSGTGMTLLAGVLAALFHRERTGRGQRVNISMQDAVLNLCTHGAPVQPSPEGAQAPAAPPSARRGNASRGDAPGWMLRCRNWKTDPNDYIYVIVDPDRWADLCQVIGKPDWMTDPEFETQAAREPHLFDIYRQIEAWLSDKDKYQAAEALGRVSVPCGPVLTAQEAGRDRTLRNRGSGVDRPEGPGARALAQGCPVRFSAFSSHSPAAVGGRWQAGISVRGPTQGPGPAGDAQRRVVA